MTSTVARRGHEILDSRRIAATVGTSHALVGDNGTGKSTLLEAIAWSVGFGAQGGNRDQSFAENADGHALGRALRLSWRQKVSGGFFLRAETFFNFATYLEDVGSPFIAYGGKSLHHPPGHVPGD